MAGCRQIPSSNDSILFKTTTRKRFCGGAAQARPPCAVRACGSLRLSSAQRCPQQPLWRRAALTAQLRITCFMRYPHHIREVAAFTLPHFIVIFRAPVISLQVLCTTCHLCSSEEGALTRSPCCCVQCHYGGGPLRLGRVRTMSTAATTHPLSITSRSLLYR